MKKKKLDTHSSTSKNLENVKTLVKPHKKILGYKEVNPLDEPVKKVKPKDKVHYVKGKDFTDQITEYYNTGVISYVLGDSLNKIANGLSYSPNFINYSYKGDMVGDAIVKMFSALKEKKFRLNTGFSPFSYFTTIAFHAFINRIKKEKKHHETITQYREKVYTETMTQKDDNGNSYNIYVSPNQNDEDD